jgi:hypothetical protein
MSPSTPGSPPTETEIVVQSPSAQFPQAPNFILHHGIIGGVQTGQITDGNINSGFHYNVQPPKSSHSDESHGGRSSLPSFPQAPDPTPIATDMAIQMNSPIGSPRQREQNGKEEDESEIKARDSRLCALELICYRSSVEGCIKGTVLTAQQDKFKSEEFVQMRDAKKEEGYALIINNEMLFKEIRRVYEREMCSFWRRWFSLTKVKSFVILKVNRIQQTYELRSETDGF